MATDFLALLEDSSETVKRPSITPAMWAYGVIGSHSFDNVRNEKQTPYVRFELLKVEPHEDTPDDIKATVAALDPPLSDREHHFDGFLTDAAKYHTTDMLDRVVGHPNLPMKVRIPQTQGQKILFKIAPQMDRRSGKPTGFTTIDVQTVTSADSKPK